MPRALAALLLCLLAAAPAWAEAVAALGPGQQCRAAIRAAERAAGIPAQLMAAIGRVESGRRAADGSVNPWPWSINAEGEGRIFESKAEAVAAVRALQARGVRSIDVGCMQVNLMHHPDAFASLEQAFDPAANAAYAARFLVELHGQTGDWPAAAALYHSATPELGAEYRRKVMAAWPEELQAGGTTAPGGGLAGAAWAMPRPAGGLTPGGFVSGIARNLPGVGGSAHIIPLASGQAGRSLAAYRAAPIPLAAAPPMRAAARREPAGRG
jgi:hypothetical protein